jgi:hypothetical protein
MDIEQDLSTGLPQAGVALTRYRLGSPLGKLKVARQRRAKFSSVVYLFSFLKIQNPSR